MWNITIVIDLFIKITSPDNGVKCIHEHVS